MRPKLGWPIDSWLLTDDYFFVGGSRWMTYSPEGDDLAGYSSFRQVRGSAGCAFGVRSSRKLKEGETNGSGAETGYGWYTTPFSRAKAIQLGVSRMPSLSSAPTRPD